MNHTSTLNIWKGSNRASLLWEALLAERVSPDPCTGEYRLPGVDLEPSFPLETWETEGTEGQAHSHVPALLEKAGFESLRLFRQALEVLGAPSEDEARQDTGRQLELDRLPTDHRQLADDPFPVDPDLVLTFVKVSSEPEPQPGSTIDTRRMAYGLKIPPKPLHKRPVYQRVFFCLRQMIRQGKDDPSYHR